MKPYSPYLSELRDLLHAARSDVTFIPKMEAAVNGQASVQLEKLVAKSQLKRTGAFFSSPTLSRAVAKGFNARTQGLQSVVADPACGAGNLLIAAARQLPVHRSLVTTLRVWGSRLAGFDLHPEFVSATHLRLALFALLQGARFDLPARTRLAAFFPLIRTGDGLRGLGTLPQVGHLLLNPPYNQITAPAGCRWGQGKTSKAAHFITRSLDLVPAGTRISAILPDVLRSGSRYHRWRQQIEKRCNITRIESMGNFETADVDVFVLDLTIGGHPPGRCVGVQWWQTRVGTKRVSDHFDVHVGAVVRHRLKRHHPVQPYLHAKGLPFWGELKATVETVRFAGSTVRPPFVIVRRTSSPTDRHRAIATLVSGRAPIAIDNHLIVCTPRQGGEARCRQLIEVLRKKRTDNFLNRRIRCRHLTVGVVREIPWVP